MRKLELLLNELDYQAIQEAIAKRQLFRAMPDTDSNAAGAVIAEICRGWMESQSGRDEGEDWKKPPN